MRTRIWYWLENLWCMWKYGKTRQQILDEYIKEIEMREWLQRTVQLYGDSQDIDHNLYFGDR